MRYTKEFEYRYHHEQLLNDASKLYNWLKEKIEEGQDSIFLNNLKNIFTSLDQFLDSNDKYIKELNLLSQATKRVEYKETFHIRKENYFNIFSSDNKEKFRKKYNDFQKEKWWDFH